MKGSENRRRWHWRFDTPEKYQKMMKGLYRMTSGVDMAIGNILQHLKTMGAADNTIVIFMSDNGMFYGERGLSDCWTMHEESIHVPCIIYDPRSDKKNRGKVVDELVLNVDLSPTILDLAGINIPEQVHGRSLAPFLRGEDPAWRSDFYCELLWHAPKPDSLKASSGSIPENEGLRTKRWKYIRWFKQQPVYEELYDLEDDPHETVNLVEDPEYSEKLDELRRRCAELRDRYTPE
jgi:arylsulfatase A-like enzyme